MRSCQRPHPRQIRCKPTHGLNLLPHRIANRYALSKNKNKAMKSIQLISVLLLFFNFSVGQSQIMKFDKGETTVISTTGLNLRAKPNTSSKVITKIPFGDKVEIMEKIFYGIDTIGSYKDYEFDSGKEFQIPIIGNWVKVKYKNFEGFLFSAYLYNSRFASNLIDEIKQSEINKKYILLFPGTYCNYNYWFYPNIQWYGMYEEKNEFSLKEIKLSFYREWHGELADMGITTNNNKNLLFIIGTTDRMIEGKVEGKSLKKLHIKGIDEVKEFELSYNNRKSKLIIKKDNLSQIISKINNQYLYPTSVVWIGDLDKDGKKDYIIQYGEKSSKTILYLSSESEKDKIIKPVAIFYSGYCC
jgi:Bacterial SH3 domain